MISNENYIKSLKTVQMYVIQQRRLREKTNVFKNKSLILEQIDYLVNSFNIERNRKNENRMRRQALMWWMRKHTNMTHREIGNFFGNYNHATVCNAVKKHNQLTEVKDPLYMDISNEILSLLKPYERDKKR